MRTAVAARCAFVLGAGALAAVAINNLPARAAEDSKPAKADCPRRGLRDLPPRMDAQRRPRPRRRRARPGLQRHLVRGLPQRGRRRRGRAGQQEHRHPERLPNRGLIVNNAIDPQARPARPLNPASTPSPESQLAPLVELHPGFKNGRTVVLHKFGIDPNYEAFREEFLRRGASAAEVGTASIQVNSSIVPQAQRQQLSQPSTGWKPGCPGCSRPGWQSLANIPGRIGQINVGSFVISRSQRNPTPLFGLGLIDAIPESAIEAMADAAGQGVPRGRRAGRADLRTGGSVGSAGRGRRPASEDFVLYACAVELGLEVPGHSQAITPQAPRYKATGLDLSADDCSSLVAYVRSLARPVERGRRAPRPRRSTWRPASRRSPASAAPRATPPSSARSRGSTATS